MTVKLTLQHCALSSDILAFENLVYMNTADFQALGVNQRECNVLLNDVWPFTARMDENTPQGKVAIGTRQREAPRIPLDGAVVVQLLVLEGSLSDHMMMSAKVEVENARRNDPNKITIDSQRLNEIILQRLGNRVYSKMQRFIINYDEGEVKAYLQCTWLEIENVGDVRRSQAWMQRKVSASIVPSIKSSAPLMNNPSKESLPLTIEFKSGPTNRIQMQSNNMGMTNLIAADFNFAQMGIGGLNTELEKIFRTAFASRVYPPAIIRQLGITHVRGMMLYGPPGTGKTTIARQIGKCLNSREPIVKSGPEMLNMYVGEGERQIRELFEAAEQEQAAEGENSQLHIVIIDEIDAICKQRGSSGGGGGASLDSIVNQLLAKIDGVNALNNILLIGMTNRLDMIDEALLRSGRMEVKCEIGLPSEMGRAEIFNIHTKEMRKHNRLAPEVDLAELAKRTKNYSGAEIEGLIRNAVSFALRRKLDFNNLGKEIPESDMANVVITKEDFEHGLTEVVPIYGRKDLDITRNYQYGVIEYSRDFQSLLKQLRVMVGQVRNVDNSETGAQVSTVLLSGNPRSGKTAIASKLVKDAEFPFVRLVSAENFVGMGDLSKMAMVTKIFDDAYKTDMACIILDDIEKLIEYVPVGARFSNVMYHGLKTLISKKPPKEDRKLFIVATTNSIEVLRQFQLDEIFAFRFDIPDLKSGSCKKEVLKAMPGFHEDPAEVDKCVQTLEGIDIGVKRLILNSRLSKHKADAENISLTQAFQETMLFSS